MLTTRRYQGVKYCADEAHAVLDVLSVEEALQIIVNGTVFTMTMRTPGDDHELVRGLLHSESVLDSPDFHPSITFERHKEDGITTKAIVTVSSEFLSDDSLNSRNLLSVSACGICGKTELENITSSARPLSGRKRIDARKIPSLYGQLQNIQQTFIQSGGSHAAACFDENGALMSIREDIGRHNAVDKVIGDMLLSGNYRKANTLLVSGRISYEIVVKAFKARIPVLCAVSAPTTMAVDYAKELGITLLAFCRDDRATCYAHPERIENEYFGQKAG